MIALGHTFNRCCQRVGTILERLPHRIEFVLARAFFLSEKPTYSHTGILIRITHQVKMIGMPWTKPIGSDPSNHEESKEDKE